MALPWSSGGDLWLYRGVMTSVLLVVVRHG